jgi:hypothetical protein
LADSYGKLPLTFELNNGQTDPRVKFLSRGHGYVLFLTSDGAVLGLQNNNPPRRGENMKEANAPASSHPGGTQNLVSTTLRMKLVNANRALRISGLEPQPGRSNYLRGNDPAKWRTQIANYSRVRYQDAYPGIDLIYYGNPQQLEYDFVVSPGADPRAITLNFATDDETARSHGAVLLRLDSNGDLIASLGDSEVRLLRPVVYQLDLPTPRQTTEQAVAPTLRNAVDARWILNAKGEAGFGIGAYDPKRPLIIDPALNYSTYLNGSSASNAYSVAVDSSGNAYVTGSTLSTDFPTSTPFQNTNHGRYDAFVAKLNSTGTGLVYSTYLGGSGTDYAFSIAVDAAGNAYVAGTTGSSDFPTTVGAFQPKCGGGVTGCKGPDIFVTKLDPSGSALSYSTYLGGTGDDRGYAIALDPAGNVYVTGKTTSPDFPTTPGSFQTTLKGPTNVFVTALNPTGSGLVYSTYLGGSASDQANAIAVDASGDAYVAGSTTSTDFPTTPGAFQTSRLGPANAFVTQVNATGNALQYSTYLGGSNTDVAWGIKVDASGNAVAVGQTLSADFPTTPGAFQTTCGGSCAANNAFVTEINATGSTLNYSTFLGGSAEQEAFAVALDSAGDAYVTGRSTAKDYPTTPGAFKTTGGVGFDATLTELDPTGSRLIYSTYFGGSASDNGLGIDVSSSGNIYVTGRTFSNNFPTTPGAFMPTCPLCPPGVDPDIFVAEFVPGDQVWPLALKFPCRAIGNTSSALTTTLSNSGRTALNISGVEITGNNPSDFGQTNSCGSSLAAGASCTISVKYTPSAPGSRSAILNLSDDAANSPQSVALTGTATPISISPGSLTFAAQVIGTSSAPQTTTLSNIGTVTANITNISLTGQYSQSNTCSSPLDPGTSCTISAVFQPTASGIQKGSISIADDQGGLQTVALRGIATAISFSPTAVNFGNQAKGTSSQPQPVTMINVGSSTITINKIWLSGGQPNNFSQTNNCGAALAAGASCTISVTFTPLTKGPLTANLTVADTGGASPQKVPVSGNGF